MLIERLVAPWLLATALCLPMTLLAQETGQYRSRILLDPLGEIGKGSEMSLQELEAQIDSIQDPYARSSATRHLARHYVSQKDYPAAINWYREALSAGGLSPVANREMLRELARIYLLAENYPAATETLEQALAIDLVPAAADYLLLAQAHYRQGDYVGVVAALDGIQANGLVLDTEQKRQALAMYYRAGAFEQCEGLLRALLEEDPLEYSYWHQLASVYLQQNKRRAAQDHLVLAMEKGISFSESELLLLVDLLAVNGNPYGAAQVLSDAMDGGLVPRSGANQRKLFELWFQSRERDSAKRTLVQAAAATGDTELYLYLAQLQLEDEEWSAAEQTVLKSCQVTLQDRYVSRANLLLGVSLLKQGREAAARQVLINATLVGGANQQAAQWLQFMDASPPTEDELRRVRGPCIGDEGRRVALVTEPASIATAAPASPERDEATQGTEAPARAIAVETAPAQRFYYLEQSGSLEEVLPQVRSQAVRLGVSLVKAGATRDGPLHLLNDDSDLRKLGFPIRGSAQPRGRYRLYNAPEFSYVSAKLDTTSDVPAQVTALVADIERAGLSLTGLSRLVLAGGENADVELQLGVE